LIFTFIRQILASSVVLLLAITIEKKAIDKVDFKKFIALGLLMHVMQISFIYGVVFAGAIISGLLKPAIPVFATTLALIFKLESYSHFKIAGVVLSVLGVIFMVEVDSLSLEKDRLIGIGCLMISTLSTAAYILSMKPIASKYVFRSFQIPRSSNY